MKALAVIATAAALSLCSLGSICAATFETVLSPYNTPTMGVLIHGPILAGDTERLREALIDATRRFSDHRMRAVGLDSPGGLVGEALSMATIIRQNGFLTVVPERSQCVSACVLLFAAGSYKIASPGSFIGVHGASMAGEQTLSALAVTTELAQVYARFGLPASVIGRMVVTPPADVAWLTAEEVTLFPGGIVQAATTAEFPEMFAAYDGMPIAAGIGAVRPSAHVPAYQVTGRALETPAPAAPAMLPAPPHPRELLKSAQQFSLGYEYGISTQHAKCDRIGNWNRGCLSGSDERSKSWYDPSTPEPTVSQQTQRWLDSYDFTYQRKLGAGDCGNGSEPSNDGCRAGGEAWPRSESSR